MEHYLRSIDFSSYIYISHLDKEQGSNPHFPLNRILALYAVEVCFYITQLVLHHYACPTSTVLTLVKLVDRSQQKQVKAAFPHTKACADESFSLPLHR